MNDETQTPDPAYVPPTIEVSVHDVATLAGLLLPAIEYLEALERVAMFEGRTRPKSLRTTRLVRDVLVQWTRENVVRVKDCSCPHPGNHSAVMSGCLVHDPPDR